MGGDAIHAIQEDIGITDFNPHLRMGGDVDLDLKNNYEFKISIHTSAWEVTHKGRFTKRWPSYFNPHLRMGGDSQFLGVCLKFTRKICEKLINFIKYIPY